MNSLNDDLISIETGHDALTLTVEGSDIILKFERPDISAIALTHDEACRLSDALNEATLVFF